MDLQCREKTNWPPGGERHDLCVTVYGLSMAPPLRTFEIGPGNAVLTVRTTKAGLAAKMAHDLTLEATAWSGSLTFDAADLAASSVEVSVVVASLTVVDSSGGVMPLSDGDRTQIARNINDKILRTKTYPDITFRSTTIEGHADTFTVTGDLTITGTTRPVSLAVTVGRRWPGDRGGRGGPDGFRCHPLFGHARGSQGQ